MLHHEVAATLSSKMKMTTLRSFVAAIAIPMSPIQNGGVLTQIRPNLTNSLVHVERSPRHPAMLPLNCATGIESLGLAPKAFGAALQPRLRSE